MALPLKQHFLEIGVDFPEGLLNEIHMTVDRSTK
jgi:hypothetical protein